MKTTDGRGARLVAEIDERLAELLPENLVLELGSVAAMCREGLMALSVEAGLAAAAIMAEEAAALCGPWNARDPDRGFRRGGTAPTSVVMGGQKLPIRRPRVHTTANSGGEVELDSFALLRHAPSVT